MKTKEQIKADMMKELKRLYPEIHKQVIDNPGCEIDVIMDIQAQKAFECYELAEEIIRDMEEKTGTPYEDNH